ncbi:hypothetical protein MNV49_003680 [Pseudohyphozyma bogoriensis]|nr:hypothetical protein MNV49_003680 [Pseudohyphozyma bogoriensis]
MGVFKESPKPSPSAAELKVNLDRRIMTVKALYVTLTSYCSIPAHKESRLAAEEKTVLVAKEDLLPPNEESDLSAGEYSYSFTLAVPPDTVDVGACSGINKEFRAKIRHQAFLEVGPETEPTSASLRIDVKSRATKVYIGLLPGDQGDTPEPLNLFLEHFSPTLGPLRMEFYSPHLTMGAPALLKLHFSGPPTDICILHIKTRIIQNFSIHYAALSPSSPLQLPTAKFPLQHVVIPASDEKAVPTVGKEMSSPRRVGKGEEWTYEDLVRMPTCWDMKASSLGLGKKTFEGKHKLGVEVCYGVEEQKLQKVVNIEAPIVVTSCVCLLESLLLPTYTVQAPNPKIKSIDYHGFLCACDYSLEELSTLFRHVAKGSPSPQSAGVERVVVPIKMQRVDSEDPRQRLLV